MRKLCFFMLLVCSVALVANGEVAPNSFENLPHERRGKKIIEIGWDSCNKDLKWFRDHPKVLAELPFHGIVVDLHYEGKLFDNASPRVQEHTFGTRTVPWEGVAYAIPCLRATKWGHLTENYMRYIIYPGTTDLDNEAEWQTVIQTARLMARIAKQGGLKGFWLDFEIYRKYPEQLALPIGQKRGKEWIQAVTEEFPDMEIIIAPMAYSYKKMNAFLDGMFEGLPDGVRIHNGYEWTYYSRQKHMFQNAYEKLLRTEKETSKFPNKFARAVDASFSVFFDPGNAALRGGDLGMALARSDEVVWIYTERSDFYLNQTHRNHPYLRSYYNQTSMDQGPGQLTEDFETDPYTRGWYADFQQDELARFEHESIPKSLLVWNSPRKKLRTRFAHRILEATDQGAFSFTFDFVINRVPTKHREKIVLGLWRSDSHHDRPSLTFRLKYDREGKGSASVVLQGKEKRVTIPVDPVPASLKKNQSHLHSFSPNFGYRITIEYSASGREMRATLRPLSWSLTVGTVIMQGKGVVPKSHNFSLDEIGVGILPNPIPKTIDDVALYRIMRIEYAQTDAAPPRLDGQ